MAFGPSEEQEPTLAELSARATAGEWDMESVDDEQVLINAGSARTEWNADRTIGHPPRSWVTTDRILETDVSGMDERDYEQVEANAEFIVALVNAYRQGWLVEKNFEERPEPTPGGERRTLTIDLDTGDWVAGGPLYPGDGTKVAASVLPGMPEAQIEQAYGDWMTSDPAPTDLPGFEGTADALKSLGGKRRTFAPEAGDYRDGTEAEDTGGY